MKRMKRVVAVILALAVILGLAGCGKTGKGNGHIKMYPSDSRCI